MAGEDLFGLKDGTKNALNAVMFMGGVYVAYDAMSTLNSSPWTHETFGQDAAKAESAQWYVRLAISRAAALGLISSLIARSPWPLLGVAVADGDLWWVYRRAYHLAQGA